MPEELPKPPADIFSDVDPVGTSHPRDSMGMPSPSSDATHAPVMMSSSRSMSRLPIIFGAVLVLGALVLGGYFLYARFAAEPAEETQDTLVPEQPIEQQPSPIAPTQPTQPTQPSQPAPVVQQPIDSDGDGLSDDAEASQYGTNPQSTDTDADGLTDREELTIYLTDPKNADTDGDTFSDGVEVRGGYNPKGPGRLFDIPQQ